MTPGADAPMIPDVGSPELPGDTTPRSGWHPGVVMGILITQFSSSENSAVCSDDGVDTSGIDDDAFSCCSDLSAFSYSVCLILARRFSRSFSGESKILKSTPVVGGLPPMLPWRARCRIFLRRVDWISYWRARDAVQPVRPESKGKVQPRPAQQLRPREKCKAWFLMMSFQLLVVVFQSVMMAFQFLIRGLHLVLTRVVL